MFNIYESLTKMNFDYFLSSKCLFTFLNSDSLKASIYENEVKQLVIEMKGYTSQNYVPFKSKNKH